MKVKRITTLEGLIKGSITENRRSGNTTRLIDNAIQIIFSGNICVVKGHSNSDHVGNYENRELFNLIIKRLTSEHQYHIINNHIVTDSKKLEIYFKEPIASMLRNKLKQ
jgi:hypothetical protein